jgi:uncharacterized YccA/Bax inhibitor family protein
VVEAGEPRTPAGEVRLRLLTGAAILATVGSFLAMAMSYQLSLQRVAGL